jgi:hypothetical protein
VLRDELIAQEGAVATLLVVDLISAMTVQDQGMLGGHPDVLRDQDVTQLMTGVTVHLTSADEILSLSHCEHLAFWTPRVGY